MEKRLTWLVTASEDGWTVQNILKKKLKLASGQIGKAKYRPDGICLNGVRIRTTGIVHQGDSLTILIEESSTSSQHLIPVHYDLEVLYEDEDLIVVYKPAGIVCHPSPGHYADSMANYMMAYFAEKHENFVVRIEGRLDKGTSGILIYAKNAPALTELERQRTSGQLRKWYYAVLTGRPDQIRPEDQSFTIEGYIGRVAPDTMKRRVCASDEDGSQYARTSCRILETRPVPQQEPMIPGTEPSLQQRKQTIGNQPSQEQVVSLAELEIATGRTHQIRVHMSSIGCPLQGDELYGGDMTLINRPALHARRVTFVHPMTGQVMDFVRPVPEDMRVFGFAHL